MKNTFPLFAITSNIIVETITGERMTSKSKATRKSNKGFIKFLYKIQSLFKYPG